MASLKRRVARAAELLADRYGRAEIAPSGRALDSLIGTVLSQSTSDTNSHRAHRELRRRFPSMKALAGASARQIESAIRSGGLAKQKSRVIHSLLRALPRRGGSPSLAHMKELGDDEAMDALTSLDGVGVKTAACVLLFALGRDVCPVDTHVHRIASRVPLAPDFRTAEKTFAGLGGGGSIPTGEAGPFHINLIRLGRELCRPRGPGCTDCPLKRICDHGRQR